MMSELNEYPTCSTCKLAVQVNCHPDNRLVGGGNMSDKLGYVCMLWANDSNVGFGIFMENTLGLCECHTPIKEDK